MSSIKHMISETLEQKIVLQGNAAFALGVLHAGYHAADGYPGTPSTEVMEALQEVPEQILAGWSVNEAVAVGVGLGHAIAGRDTLVTMKVPGLFQAADVVASIASSRAFTGALVLFVATDHAPSSSQYLVDARHFLASIRLPVLEPRDHQDLYQSARIAADLSRSFATPVVILCSSVLCHAEGIISPHTPRTIAPAACRAAEGHVLLPQDALRAFRHSVVARIPAISAWAEDGLLSEEQIGNESFGIIATGEAALIVREAMSLMDIQPSLLTLGITHPLPLDKIRHFAKNANGRIHLFEDGERFVEMALRAAGVSLVGKEDELTITNWTPDQIVRILSQREGFAVPQAHRAGKLLAPKRPPSICPGCPYKAVSLAIQSFKQRKILKLVFGDIGCSTLLHHQDALDLNLCMGASESMRQGYVLSNPNDAGHVISLIGDSSECHSGMDATRNAVYRHVPGVKVVLDNSAIAMTGAQSSPTSKDMDSPNAPFQLVRALEAEGARAVRVDSYNREAVEAALLEALRLASEGTFSTIVLEGSCLEVSDRKAKANTQLLIDTDLCLQCGSCDICPGIEAGAGEIPKFTSLCTRCGEGDELCLSSCPVQAISVLAKKQAAARPTLATIEADDCPSPPKSEAMFPESLRVAVCGVGGQGNLFLGKVLAQVVRTTPYVDQNIVKGEIHGMAQKGGTVCSTFACGDVHSPIFAAGSVDFLIAMERGELLRPEFIRLLKPNGIILLNDHAILPAKLAAEKYPSLEAIRASTSSFQTIVVRASEIAPRNANAVLLGLLSGLHPFSQILTEVWVDALRRLSPNESIMQGNLFAFHKGRHHLSLQDVIALES